MTEMTQDEVIAGLVDEWDRLGRLIRSLDPAQWRAPSRCAGWTVADVAGHAVGLVADLAAGKAEPATPEVTGRQAAERRDKPPADVADELDEVGAALAGFLRTLDDATWNGPLPEPLGGTLGEGVQGLRFDAYVHGDDIRHALGLDPDRGPGLDAAADRVRRFAAQSGQRFPDDADPHTVVLAGTGRADPGPLGLTDEVNLYR